ncbi:MAG: mitochondrial genome maintenance MGM101-domain-containing protein [Olpidium bornovanus]|uniref:Mitochondrial genome maintenance protein MGM101 n=1 Tax=Olpidium bornovanus TaxID=278681 RepID=A0A8H7ZQW4_9FUNG|nr:MAG: mitochondrial genome maintenance MGM101-domain-containing protein [Olpidium bornovanus]
MLRGARGAPLFRPLTTLRPPAATTTPSSGPAASAAVPPWATATPAVTSLPAGTTVVARRNVRKGVGPFRAGRPEPAEESAEGSAGDSAGKPEGKPALDFGRLDDVDLDAVDFAAETERPPPLLAAGWRGAAAASGLERRASSSSWLHSAAPSEQPAAGGPSPRPAAAPEPPFPAPPVAPLHSDPFPPEVVRSLLAPVAEADVLLKPRPGGGPPVPYLSHVFYRRLLNRVFGPGAWALLPAGGPVERAGVVSREFALFVKGKLVSQALGEHDRRGDGEPVEEEMTFETAVEAAKSRALRRCCKDLGVGLELWDKEGWVAGWQARQMLLNSSQVVSLPGESTNAAPFSL